MKPTCTTISGRTQWARTLGSPEAFVNGDPGCSIASRRARRSSSSLVSKPVPSFPGVDEVVALVISDEQGTKADARPLRIRKTAHDELLRCLALHLEPVLRSPVLVRRAAPLGDDAFPALAGGAFPRVLVFDERRRVPGAV